MKPSNRTDEKIGWTGGWAGCFIRVAVLAIVFFFRGSYMQGATGLLLAATAYAIAMFFPPGGIL